MTTLKDISDRHRMACEAKVEALGLNRDDPGWWTLSILSERLFVALNECGVKMSNKPIARKAIVIILRSHADAMEEADREYLAGKIKLESNSLDDLL